MNTITTIMWPSIPTDDESSEERLVERVCSEVPVAGMIQFKFHERFPNSFKIQTRNLFADKCSTPVPLLLLASSNCTYNKNEMAGEYLHFATTTVVVASTSTPVECTSPPPQLEFLAENCKNTC